MSKGDLETCLSIDVSYYCQQPVRIINSLDGTCEAFLFKKKMEEAKMVCPLEFSLLTEKAIRIDPLTMIVYGRKDHIQYHCTDLSNSDTKGSFPMKEIKESAHRWEAHAPLLQDNISGTLIPH